MTVAAKNDGISEHHSMTARQRGNCEDKVHLKEHTDGPAREAQTFHSDGAAVCDELTTENVPHISQWCNQGMRIFVVSAMERVKDKTEALHCLASTSRERNGARRGASKILGVVSSTNDMT